MIRDIFISLRPRQWLKNTFVFAALVFARQFADGEKVLLSLLVFVIFSLLSGAVYLINDVADIKEDRKHREKRDRPIAAGRLSPSSAIAVAVITSLLALAGAFLISSELGLVALVYLLLMGAYTLFLKRIIIVDVLVIAFGFILRVLAGGVAIAVPISEWLYICTFLLALFLALSKRRYELVMMGAAAAGHRKTLAEYSSALLDQMIAVVTSSTVMAYALYTLYPRTRVEVSPRLYYSIPFVLYGIFRYLYLIHRKAAGGEPGRTLLTDRALLLDVLLWVLSIIIILHFFPPR
ncbi:MAG: decaprenyl-phosphate phosphoribosyltransferase [Candidatus Euphemobacter frigidus]|nr:decaprenyl-phosphate phosphoribosyltransferase [Candidatus Euphemobacter frigidus]MDP8276772.1 decaprenyl-phosphate phosphoribosyltransferase [Candidatus Euphemobacter frigidus]